MLVKDRLRNYPRHHSQRGEFAFELYKQMVKNENIWLVLPDLGYKMFDSHCQDFPDRVVICGASECAAIGVCVGLALKGKIPFIFSITNFILYRPYEWLRNYVNHENIPIKLIGGGRDKDYQVDSFTHTCEEAKDILKTLPKIVQFWPMEIKDIPLVVKQMVENNKPSFVSLKR